MIAKLTDTMVAIEGEALRPVTWVVVEEVTSGQWGVGGNGLTTADVKALQQRSRSGALMRVWTAWGPSPAESGERTGPICAFGAWSRHARLPTTSCQRAPCSALNTGEPQ